MKNCNLVFPLRYAHPFPISSSVTLPDKKGRRVQRVLKQSVRGLLLVVVSLLLAAPGARSQNYWSGGHCCGGDSYSVQDDFKVTFDDQNGRLIITAFALDEGFFDHSTLAGKGATLYFSKDNGNTWYSFYVFSWDQNHSMDYKYGTNGYGATSSSLYNHDITVYLPINNNLIGINSIKLAYEKLQAENHDDQQNVSGTKTISIPELADLKISQYTFQEKDRKAELQWSSTSNKVTDQSYTSLYDDAGNWVSSALKGATSGTFLVPQSNAAKKYRLYQTAYNKRVGLYSDYFTVPAFTHPDSIWAVYDPGTDKVNITWTIPEAIGDYEKSDFKLQRATKSDFSDAVDVEGFSASQSRKYDPNLTSYTFADNPHANVYYRIARNLRPDWGWTLGKSLYYSAVHAAITDSSHVTLTLDNPNIRATLTWDTAGIWTHGATFIITRLNRTNNTSTAINLDKEDYYKGQYIDSLITPCNQYYYTLQVKPADNSGFDTYKPFMTTNSVLPVEIGTITNLMASKGYFPDRTTLQWHSKGQFDNYIVKRKVYGSSDDFIQIANIAGSSTSDLQTDDSKGAPGVYYQYMVVGAVNCNNEVKYSQDTLYAIGFRSPTGNIYGRVTYENGQSVENVAVRLQNNDDTRLGQSIYLNGTPASYLSVDSLHRTFEDSAFSIGVWIRPDDAAPANQVIFSRNGQYELGFDADGQLYFSYDGNTVTGKYINQNQIYVHVAAIHNRDSLLLMINDSVIASKAVAFTAAIHKDKTVYIGRNESGHNFKGYVDEMAVWNIALTPSWFARNYTLLLAGGEKGLAAYWRFDETITDEFYDLSHRNEQYNRNDGVMDAAAVQRSSLIPDSYQLSLKAYTDSTGNYMISGVPYSGQGTTYTIVPLFGTHQFDPAAVNRLISSGSASFAVDFTDRSSFAVTGYIYYFNSTVPVPGVQFLIDGKYAQQGNGELIQTGDDGKFTISVPVGMHEVRAVKSNHVFMQEGRITDLDGNDLNYQAPGGPYTLYDSTTIRFIGRVAGGAVQEALPLGHSLSTNNLGKELKVILQLPSGTKYDLYKGEEPDSTILVSHLLPSGEHDSSKTHKTRVVYDRGKDQIIIYPDSLTGEFEADLIPEKFIASSVTATGWPELLDNGSVSLDLSNQFIDQYSIYKYEDSVAVSSTSWKYNDYTDSVRYNYAYQFIKRKIPTVSVIQLDNSGQPSAYFGDSIYTYHSLSGEEQQVAVIDPAKTGQAAYLFGYPVFTQGKPYRFRINAYEEYPFYSGVKPDGTPIPLMDDGHPVVDKVATQDGVVSLNNYIRDGSTQTDTLGLDSTGTGYYDFTAGAPEIAPPGTKDFSLSVRFGQSTDVNWSWLGNQKMPVYVMGAKLTGNDFVTAGPNKILMVLRDPPGNRSYSYVESGSTVSNSSTYTGTADQVGDIETIISVGATITTWVGVGGGTATTVEANNKADITIHHEEHYTGTNSTANSTTFTTRFQTSDDPLFVGPPADLYVGYSTNITYGQSSNLVIIKREDLKSTDIVMYEASPTSEYLLINRTGINFGQKFGTLFAYPQQHIIKILIPNLISIRNNLLLPPTTSASQAQQKANLDKTAVYVSKLSSDDSRFGKSNYDTTAFGISALSDPVGDGESYKIYFPENSKYRTDTIMILNEYIQGWQDEIARNEEAKINARSNLIQNYSFHAGNPVNYSVSRNVSHSTTNSFNIILSAASLNTATTEISDAGIQFKITESIGTQQGGSFEKSSDTTTTMGFQLAADGTDEYLSVDANAAIKNETPLPGITIPVFDGFAFSTKGGQTGCPYEAANYSQYYTPGTLLDQPTTQIEVPKIKVDNPVVNNVPSTQKASYTLYLSNESEAKLPATFVLSYANTDSIKGAYIAVDGASIAGGRAFAVQYGETVKKVLTITKGPDAMDYNNIPIILHSSCQYDPTGYQALIADTVLLSAHFVPSCSNVNLKAPQDQWILNTLSQTDPQGKRYIPVTLDQFDMSNNLFNHIELQYKPAANSQWVSVMNFYGDSAKFNAAQGDKTFITNAQAINYNLQMDDATYNDQKYDIRALAVCQLGPGNFINTPSNIVHGIKDTYNPRPFGTPEPGNGILAMGDDIRLNFNEPIAAGLLTPSDFRVTGIRNGAQGDHSVSVDLDGQKDMIRSEFDKNLSGKDITAEMWVLPDGQQDGTVFSQGNSNESLELSFTTDNHLQLIVGKKKIISDKPLDYKPGEWAHVALAYHAADSTISAFYNFQAVIHEVSVQQYRGQGPLEFGGSISGQGAFFAGKMHEARIWTRVLTPTTLQTGSLKRLSGAEEGLLAYYPMTEGKGSVILDKAHGNNAILTGSWSTPPGKAISLDGKGYVKIATGTTPITTDMDYTIGLWFKAKPGQQDATLVSSGKGDGSDVDPKGSKNLFCLGFEGGILTFENNGFKVQADGHYLDNQWHHVALAVNRVAGTGRLLVDDTLRKFFNTQNLGGLSAAYTYLGARGYLTDTNAVTPVFDHYFSGEIDEFRIWNTYLDQTLLANNSNVRLNGDELGLLAYYPFEKYVEFQGQKLMDFTLDDQKIQELPNVHVPAAVAFNADENNNMAPIKDRGPVSNLQFDFVVNNDALIINLLEPKQAIDKTTVTFQADDVKDLNGNPLASPITWSAYIDQNPVKWGDEELNLTKELYAPMQFETYIVNSGGSIQHFTLDGLPPWLTADITNGTVAPEGKQKITFTINEGLNVGTYNEIVYMGNDNGETEALQVNVKVRGQMPDWKVNPADFKYNMTVYGKLRIDHIFSADPEDVLAAFVDGKCVGITHNSYFAGQDLWYAFLTVYGDSLSTDHLEFRIWDASTGKIFEGIPSESITFLNDQVVGTPDDPVIFDGKELLFSNINLNKGWNWISFNLVSQNLKSTAATLANGSWSPGDVIKHDLLGFDQYSYAVGWIGTLPGLDDLSLFKLKTGLAQTLSFSGTPPEMSNTPITVKGNQWNYISYLPLVNMTLKEALADYQATSGDEIKSQTGFSMYSETKGWIGNLTYLEPGKGYMLFRKGTTDTHFTYPEISGSLTILRLAGNSRSESARLNGDQLPVENNFAYADNMTVIATAGKEFTLLPTDQILVYSDASLAGKAKLINNPLTGANTMFFNISGASHQLVHFEVERGGKIVAQTDPVMDYMANSMVGTLSQPLVLHFGKSLIQTEVFPNPFSKMLTIRAVLPPGVHEIQTSIYDINGKLVMLYPKEMTGGKYYEVKWDGRNSSGSPCSAGVYLIHVISDKRTYVYKVVKY